MDNIILPKMKKKMETLILAVRIYSEDIGMEFAMEKVPC